MWVLRIGMKKAGGFMGIVINNALYVGFYV